MMPFRTAIALLFLTLSACATIPDISQSRSPCRMEPGGWCSFVREGAVEAYPYAIASLQAYEGDRDLYTGPIPMLEALEALPIDPDAKDKGFGYVLFKQFAPGTYGDAGRQPIARIFAFRGTDFDGFTDIFYGSLRNDQINLAVEAFAAEAARFDDSVPWVVTGHSLGGALATEVSVANPQVRAFMFNTSPFYGGDAMSNDVRRTVFNERGELLRRFAKFKSAPAAEVYTINCQPGTDPIKKHSMRRLVDCLTWIAAYSDRHAFQMVETQRIERPMVECRREQPGHPGVAHREITPCVHQSRPDKDSEPDEADD
ncbi:hypothetical protein EH31_04265 [Erythrobacter longus]|uniref:Fungal lipase-like domain-containing protein n=1 Tax=Erythrobacter longus TaxID=1044 RepID=A0A074MEJ5_ERYLO|nr:alpha/beta hydrolase [Erythrobacter longus]KEO91894.1 hypothetical protein EH31_04265 [Erythrobacter longus]